MVTKFQILPIANKTHHFANYFWDIEADVQDRERYRHSLIPKGIGGLIYVYKGAFRVEETGEVFSKGDLLFGGPRSKIATFTLEENTAIMGVSLLPYIGSLLFDTPGSNLIDQVMKCNNHECFVDLIEAFGLSNSNNERIDQVNIALTRIAQLIEKQDLAFFQLMDEMSRARPTDLEELVAKSNLSLRQFQRKFKSFTGYTPTEYLRIARMQPILSASNPESLTELALQFGFYDQSHFINYFKKITGGLTPRQYFDKTGKLKWIVMGEHVTEFTE